MKIIALIAALMAATPAASASLTVSFAVTEVPTGQIMLSLYDSETAHDRGGKPARVAAVAVKEGNAVAQFDGLAPGRYAVKSFHDVDGDGKMAVTPFGMPTEPFAFSNNAQPQGGPPAWAATSFAVEGDAVTHSITIR